MALAARQLSQKVVHVLSCFVEKSNIETALNVPVSGFKMFCEICVSLLPKDYNQKLLDCFMQYQWQVSEGQNRTFLEFPKNMKHGKWLCAATTDNYREVRMPNPDDGVKRALYYVNEAGDTHPFTRTGWYMNSPFANQYVDEAAESEDSSEDSGETNIVEQKSAWSQ